MKSWNVVDPAPIYPGLSSVPLVVIYYPPLCLTKHPFNYQVKHLRCINRLVAAINSKTENVTSQQQTYSSEVFLAVL